MTIGFYPYTDLLSTAIAGLDAGDDGRPCWSAAAALARAVVAEDLPLVPLLPHGRGVRLAHGTARFQPQRHRRCMGQVLNNEALVAGRRLPVRTTNQRQCERTNAMFVFLVSGDASGRPSVVTPARHRFLIGSHPVLFIVTGTRPPLQTPGCLFRLCWCRRNMRRAPPLDRMNYWRDILEGSCHFIDKPELLNYQHLYKSVSFVKNLNMTTRRCLRHIDTSRSLVSSQQVAVEVRKYC